MDVDGWSPPPAPPRRRRRTLIIVGAAAGCGFVAFMALLVWALQGLDTGEAHTPWPLVVMTVVAVAPLVLGYVLRRWRGVGWGVLGLAGGVVLTIVGFSVIGTVGAAVTG
jgi:drug/metabolite transporter (DMT)-like permease